MNIESFVSLVKTQKLKDIKDKVIEECSKDTIFHTNLYCFNRIITEILTDSIKIPNELEQIMNVYSLKESPELSEKPHEYQEFETSIKDFKNYPIRTLEDSPEHYQESENIKNYLKYPEKRDYGIPMKRDSYRISEIISKRNSYERELRSLVKQICYENYTRYNHVNHLARYDFPFPKKIRAIAQDIIDGRLFNVKCYNGRNCHDLGENRCTFIHGDIRKITQLKSNLINTFQRY